MPPLIDSSRALYDEITCCTVDGLVKSTQKGHSNPIYFVVGFLKLHDILHVWSRNFKKHYASYIKLFPEPSENFEHTFYETVTVDDNEKLKGFPVAIFYVK